MTTTPFQPKSLDDIYDASPEPAAPAQVDAPADPSQSTGEPPAADPAAAAAAPAEQGDGNGAPPAPGGDKDGRNVPVKALEDERKKRQKAERDLEALMKRLEQSGTKEPAKKADRPDPLVDPEGYADAIRNELFVERVEDSRTEMIDEVGQDEFEAKEAAFLAAAAKDPDLKARLRRSRDPAGFAYKQGKKILEERETEAVRSTGVDIAALEAQLEAKLMAKYGLKPVDAAAAASAPAAPASQPAAKPRVPTSLAGVPSAASRSSGAGAPVRKSMDELYV